MAKQSPGYHFGDTWCSGGFTLQELANVTDLILKNYDVPAWPELLGLGEHETLSGFWLPLYQHWLEPENGRPQLDQVLANRPGIKLFHHKFVGSPLNLIKGQMIGPATLKWCLQNKKSAIGSDDHIVKFIVEAAIAQIQVLSKFSLNIVLCFDEPAAALCNETEDLWQEVFVGLDKYRPYGLALHCCGGFKPQWLDWPWQVVHLDIHECLNYSLQYPKEWREAFARYFARGSWLAAGALSSSAIALEPFDPLLLNDFLDSISEISNNQIMFSSTCGIDCKSEGALIERLAGFEKIYEF